MSVPPSDFKGTPGIHYCGLKMSLHFPFKWTLEPLASFGCCCAAQYSFEEMLCSDKITADNVNTDFILILFYIFFGMFWSKKSLECFFFYFFLMTIKQLFIQYHRAVPLLLPSPLPLPKGMSCEGITSPVQLWWRKGAGGEYPRKIGQFFFFFSFFVF